MRPIATIYDYYDAHGTLLHQTVRYAIPTKDFRQRRPDPAHLGQYIWDLQGIEPVLYHLPAVLAALHHGEIVYLVEGEKDADRLQTLGLTATTNPMGAGAWRESYTMTLRGAQVVLLPDNDEAGMDHATHVGRRLTAAGIPLKVVLLPHLPDKGDVSDWVDAGGTPAALEALVHGTPGWTPPPRRPQRPPRPLPPRADSDLYALAARALESIPNQDAPYDDWLRYGMGLHRDLGDAGEALWDTWSRRSEKYHEKKQRRTWQSFKPGGKVGLGTIFYAAKHHGWQDPRTSATRVVPDMTRPWHTTARIWAGSLPTIAATEVPPWH